MTKELLLKKIKKSMKATQKKIKRRKESIMFWTIKDHFITLFFNLELGVKKLNEIKQKAEKANKKQLPGLDKKMTAIDKSIKTLFKMIDKAARKDKREEDKLRDEVQDWA